MKHRCKNCFKLLAVGRGCFEIKQNPEIKLEVDLPNQTLSYSKNKTTFDIDGYKKICLMEGYDDLDFLLNKKEAIEKFEQQRTVTY